VVVAAAKQTPPPPYALTNAREGGEYHQFLPYCTHTSEDLEAQLLSMGMGMGTSMEKKTETGMDTDMGTDTVMATATATATATAKHVIQPLSSFLSEGRELLLT
jgi:hypothetical protein